MVKFRKITNIGLAIEQYEDFCKENIRTTSGDRKKETVNKDYSYLNKRQGYWYLRDNHGWMIAFVDRLRGRVFLP